MHRSAPPLLALTLGACLSLACNKSPTQPAPGEAAAEPGKAADPADPKDAPAAKSEPIATPTPPEAAKPPAAAPEPAPIAARPMYFDRPITDADLEGRTLRELTLMRNTIYARIGQRFRKQWLSDYFTAQPWYTPAEKVDEGSLGELDLKNAEAIVDFEAKIPAARLRELRDAINERMRGETATPEDLIEFQLIAVRLGEWEGGDVIERDRRNPLEDAERLDALLAVDDLADMSLRDLRILRNTVYARRGREFRSILIRQYFEDKAWYEPREDYSDKLLTAVDRKNIRIIKSLEEELGGPITDWGHMAEEGWFYGA